MITKKPVRDKKPLGSFWENPWSKLIASIAGISTIFGVGFAIGIFKESFDSKMEKLEIKQECNEKLQVERNNCRETLMSQYRNSITDLENVVKELKNNNYEK
ncbi:MAG: hypothetical protein HZA79_07445 [Sphingobacteriales bacterium]|nr:hypothetical protein [Sphingobacteriales bacterium]